MRKYFLTAFLLGLQVPIANAQPIWDGSIVFTSVQNIACPFSAGSFLSGVYQNPLGAPKSTFNFFGTRLALNLENDSTTSSFNDTGSFVATLINGVNAKIFPGNYIMQFDPPNLTSLTRNFDIEAQVTGIANCGTMKFRGGFTRRP